MKLSLALALSLVSAMVSVPALAHESGDQMYKMGHSKHGKMHAMGHKMRAKRMMTKHGMMMVCPDHGCLMTMSKDGNRMSMMSPKGDMMVADKAKDTMMMMGADGNEMKAMAKDSPEGKMAMDHAMMMMKKMGR